MEIQRFEPRPPEDIPAVRQPPDAPFVRSFPIGWGDLDSAQIAYTGRLPDFAVRSVEGCIGAILGGNFHALHVSNGLDTPFVHLSADFVSPVTPAADLDCTVHVERVGTSSIACLVAGRQAGRLCFVMRTVNVLLDATVFRPAPIPPNVRATIEAYRARFPAPPEVVSPR